MTSACTISDAAITMLTAASVFGTGMVKRELYDVMEYCSGSCAVINIANGQAELSEFGNMWDDTWTIRIDGFSKDTGNPIDMKDRIVMMIDRIFDTFKSDPTMQGTVDEINTIAVSYNPLTDLVGNYGAAWANPTFTVTVKKYA